MLLPHDGFGLGKLELCFILDDGHLLLHVIGHLDVPFRLTGILPTFIRQRLLNHLDILRRVAVAWVRRRTQAALILAVTHGILDVVFGKELFIDIVADLAGIGRLPGLTMLLVAAIVTCLLSRGN